MKKNSKSLLSNRKGSFAVALAIVIPLLVVGISAAVDMSRYMIIKSNFNSALDGAVLAAATVVETQDAEVVANNFFEANFPDKYMNTVNFVQDGKTGPVVLDVKKVENNGNNKLTITGEASANIELVFANMLGISNIKISHTAKVERVVKSNVEIVLTVDVSPSMCTEKSYSTTNNGDRLIILTPDKTCKKLESMKLAMKKFVNHVFENSAIDTIKIGIVPYNHKVMLPYHDQKNKIPPSLESIEPKNYYNDFEDASPLPMVVPLTSNKATLISAIDNIDLVELDGNGDMAKVPVGWTRTTVGLHTAALMLDPDSYQYFNTDLNLKPKPFGDSAADKVIIQMTDGANIGCCYGHVNGDYNKQYQYLYKADMDYEQELCTQLKKSVSSGGGSVTIFSVIFDVDDGDYKDTTSQNISGDQREGGKWIKELFKGCTSNPDQFFFDVNVDNNNYTESDIEKVYTTIAQYFYKTRIIE